MPDTLATDLGTLALRVRERCRARWHATVVDVALLGGERHRAVRVTMRLPHRRTIVHQARLPRIAAAALTHPGIETVAFAVWWRMFSLGAMRKIHRT